VKVMGRVWDKVYPVIVSFFITGVFLSFGLDSKLEGFEKVLDGTITFASIVVGFLAALLAIILSISKSKVMKHLYNYIDVNKGKKILFSFFQQSIASGFVVVILSIAMYLVIELKDQYAYHKVAFYLWLFLSIFFVVTTYRIINILMKALFIEAGTASEKNTNQPNHMSEESIDQFKNESIRKS
jgi:hypothetical protein